MKSRVRAWLALLTLALCLGAVACEKPSLPVAEQVEQPDASRFEESVRRQVESKRAAVDKALAAGDAVKAADAWGGLGELYLAYELPGPAAGCFRNAAALDPKAFVWPYLLGLTAQAAGDPATAQGHFQRALELNAGYPQAHARLVELALARGDAAAADKHLARLEGKAGFDEFRAAKGRAAFPDPVRARVAGLAVSAESLLEQGRQALLGGQPADAEAAFRRGLQANARHSELRLELARAIAAAGRADEALATVKGLVADEPRNARAHLELGRAYHARQLDEDAIAAYGAALEIDPRLADAWLGRSEALTSLKRFDEAAAAAESGLTARPNDGGLRYARAMALHGRGSSAAAIEQLKALAAAEPRNVDALRGLAKVLGDTGRVGEAVAIHRQLADATPDQAEAVRVLDDGAKIAWRKGQRDQSVALWRRAIEIDPASSAAFTNLANGLQLMNRRDEARVDFAKAIELDPKNSAAWLSESALMILAGEFRGARQRLELALTHNPDHPALMGTLARLLSTCPEDGVRDGVKALQLAQRALAIDNKLEHAETAAMALAEMGQFEQAIRYQRSLAQQAQQRGERQSVVRLLGTLRTFEQRRPIRAYT